MEMRCPRCDEPLKKAGVACEKQQCRPKGLRVVRLKSMVRPIDEKPGRPQGSPVPLRSP